MDQVEESLNEKWGKEREEKESKAKAKRTTQKAAANENKDTAKDLTPRIIVDDSEDGSFEDDI